jgi:hypothetical protein
MVKLEYPKHTNSDMKYKLKYFVAAVLFSVKANAQEIKAELNKEVKDRKKFLTFWIFLRMQKETFRLLFFFMVPEKEEII